MRWLPACALIAASVAACSDDSDVFFERTKGLSQTGRVAFADVVPGDWNKVCFYGGYEAVPELKIENDETDWTLVLYRGDAEISRIQGTYQKLVLNSDAPRVPDCHGRDAVLVWEQGLAMFRGGGK
jgi:hypothetical protein